MTTLIDHSEQLHDAADAFVAGMDRTERVVWLQKRGLTDEDIFQALLNPDDPDLDGLTRDNAHDIAAHVANGELSGKQIPHWLR